MTENKESYGKDQVSRRRMRVRVKAKDEEEDGKEEDRSRLAGFLL